MRKEERDIEIMNTKPLISLINIEWILAKQQCPGIYSVD